MPYEKSHDEADHRKVLAAIQQYRDQGPDWNADLNQLVAHSLQRLQCAKAWIWSDSGAAVPAPNVLIANVEPVHASDFEFALVRAARVRYEWSVSLIEPGKLAHANARGMIQQAVQHCDAVTEVGLKQRQERAAVPRSQRNYADASSVVTTDPFGMEVAAIDLVIEVVRLGQLRQKSAAAAGECSTGEELLYGGSEPRRRVLRDSAKDRRTVVTKVWT